MNLGQSHSQQPAHFLYAAVIRADDSIVESQYESGRIVDWYEDGAFEAWR